MLPWEKASSFVKAPWVAPGWTRKTQYKKVVVVVVLQHTEEENGFDEENKRTLFRQYSDKVLRFSVKVEQFWGFYSKAGFKKKMNIVITDNENMLVLSVLMFSFYLQYEEVGAEQLQSLLNDKILKGLDSKNRPDCQILKCCTVMVLSLDEL